MALFTDIQDAEAHEGQWFVYWEDQGKQVRCRIKLVPHDTDRRLRRTTVQAGKARQSQNRELHEVMQRYESYESERAIVALLDTENFAMKIGDAAAAALYSKFLGEKVEVGAEVLLDGKWTEELRRHVLTRFSPLANFISDKSGELEVRNREAEEEDAEDF